MVIKPPPKRNKTKPELAQQSSPKHYSHGSKKRDSCLTSSRSLQITEWGRGHEIQTSGVRLSLRPAGKKTLQKANYRLISLLNSLIYIFAN